MEKEEKKPILIYQKNADKTWYRVMLPRDFVAKHGLKYYMEIYEDEIRLKPIKKEGK